MNENYSIESRVWVKNHDMFVANAEATIYFGGMQLTIKELSVVNGGQGLFVNWPTRAYNDTDGKTKYKGILYANEALRDAVAAAVLNKYNAEVNGGPKQPAQQQAQVQRQPQQTYGNNQPQAANVQFNHGPAVVERPQTIVVDAQPQQQAPQANQVPWELDL